jgi:hypothetical protein
MIYLFHLTLTKDISMPPKWRETGPWDEPQSLMDATVKLINDDPRTLLEIWRDTGVPFYWLQNLVKYKYANPSVNRVQYIYEKLSGEKLAI